MITLPQAPQLHPKSLAAANHIANLKAREIKQPVSILYVDDHFEIVPQTFQDLEPNGFIETVHPN